MNAKVAAFVVLLLIAACTGPAQTPDRRPDMPERPRGEVALNDEAARLRVTVNELLSRPGGAAPEKIEDEGAPCTLPGGDDGFPRRWGYGARIPVTGPAVPVVLQIADELRKRGWRVEQEASQGSDDARFQAGHEDGTVLRFSGGPLIAPVKGATSVVQILGFSRCVDRAR